MLLCLLNEVCFEWKVEGIFSNSHHIFSILIVMFVTQNHIYDC
jgi:hypothetical protein